MKILHIIPSVAEVRGGPSKAVLEMVKALVNQNINVEIVTTNDNGAKILNVPLRQKINYKGVPITFFSRFSPPLNSLREFAFSSEFTRWLMNHIKDYDLIHVHGIFSYPSTIAMLMARLNNIPYICRPLGQLCQWSLQQSAPKKQFYLNLIERANLNYCSGLHLTTQLELEEVFQLNLNCPNFVIPLGISVPDINPNAGKQLREKLELPDDEIIILFMSRLHPKKGLDYLIPALAKLGQYQFTFVLAGSGSTEYEAEIDTLLYTTGMTSRTKRTGFVQGEMKNLLLQGSNLFALTSHSENFGIAVLEALAVGLPVIITPGVALASVVKQEEIGYVTPLKIEAVASTIEHCLTHLEELKNKGFRACEMIQNNYTWETIATKLVSIYQEIIDQKHNKSKNENLK